MLYVIIENVFMFGFSFKNTQDRDIGITESRCLDRGCVKKHTIVGREVRGE